MRPRVTSLALSHAARDLPDELVFRVAQYAQIPTFSEFLRIATLPIAEAAEAWGDASDRPLLLREQTEPKRTQMVISLSRMSRQKRVHEAYRAKRLNPGSRVFLFDGKFSRSPKARAGFVEARESEEGDREFHRLESLFDLPPTIVRFPGPRKPVRAATDVTLSHARVVFLEQKREDFPSSTGMLVEHEFMEERLAPIKERMRNAIMSLFGGDLPSVHMRIVRDDVVRVKMTEEQMREASKSSWVDVWITEAVAVMHCSKAWTVRLRGEILRCHDDYTFF